MYEPTIITQENIHLCFIQRADGHDFTDDIRLYDETVPRFSSGWSEQMFAWCMQENGDCLSDCAYDIVLSWGDLSKMDTVIALFNKLRSVGHIEPYEWMDCMHELRDNFGVSIQPLIDSWKTK